MAFVLLPCDLPYWDEILRVISSLKDNKNPEQAVRVIHCLYTSCDDSLDPTVVDPIPSNYFSGMKKFLESEEVPDFYTKILPTMVESALNLKELKPSNGLMYSLQQEDRSVSVDRQLATSLLAHIFFCTLPRRTPLSHPTLSNPCLAPVLSSLHRKSQQVKLKAFLQYFNIVSQSPGGEITFTRKVMTSDSFLSLKAWQESPVSLCPVSIHHEGCILRSSKTCSLGCFSSSRLGEAALGCKNSQQVTVMASFPELLLSSLFVEKLEDNEAVQVGGTLRTSIISDLKTNPAFQPLFDSEPLGVVHCIMDADNYSLSESIQYEDINILRELNKAFLAFSQEKQDSGASQHPTPSYKSCENKSERQQVQFSANISKVQEFSKGPKEETSASSSVASPMLADQVKEANDGTNQVTDVKNTSDLKETEATQSGSVTEKLITALIHKKKSRRRERKSKSKHEQKSPDSQRQETQPEDNFSGVEAATNEAQGPSEPGPRKSTSSSNTETTVLLNRVLQAIKLLEEEGGGKSCKENDTGKTSASFSGDEMSHKSPPVNALIDSPDAVKVLEGKPPIPEQKSRKTPAPESSADRRQRSLSVKRRGTCQDGRTISMYETCLSELASTHASLSNAAPRSTEESVYYSAWESLEERDNLRTRPRKDKEAERARRASFADRLRAALDRGESGDEEPQLCATPSFHRQTEDTRSSREGSCGFLLSEDRWNHRICSHKAENVLEHTGSGGDNEGIASDSSVSSSSSSFSSDLEEAYGCLEEILETLEAASNPSRTKAISSYVKSLLKRGLSESSKGVTVNHEGSVVDPGLIDEHSSRTTRSLSLTGHLGVKPADLRSCHEEGNGREANGNMRPVVTGNWGCGSLKGNHQLKALLQWAAASQGGAPRFLYYTYGHPTLVKMDTVCRLLTDRSWTVGDITSAILQYCQLQLGKEKSATTYFDNQEDKGESLEDGSLFAQLISSEKSGCHGHS